MQRLDGDAHGGLGGVIAELAPDLVPMRWKAQRWVTGGSLGLAGAAKGGWLSFSMIGGSAIFEVIRAPLMALRGIAVGWAGDAVLQMLHRRRQRAFWRAVDDKPWRYYKELAGRRKNPEAPRSRAS